MVSGLCALRAEALESGAPGPSDAEHRDAFFMPRLAALFPAEDALREAEGWRIDEVRSVDAENPWVLSELLSGQQQEQRPSTVRDRSGYRPAPCCASTTSPSGSPAARS